MCVVIDSRNIPMCSPARCVLLHTLRFVCFKLVLVIAVNWMEPQNPRFKVALQTEALFCVDLVIRSSSGWFSMVSVAKQQKHSRPLDPERKPRAMLVSAHSLGITTGRKQAEWTSSGVIDTALGLSAWVWRDDLGKKFNAKQFLVNVDVLTDKLNYSFVQGHREVRRANAKLRCRWTSQHLYPIIFSLSLSLSLSTRFRDASGLRSLCTPVAWQPVHWDYTAVCTTYR